MAEANAELMITPEVSQTAIKKMQADFKKGFKKIGDDAQKTIEKDVNQGITGGLRGASRKITGAFRGAGAGIAAGFNKVGGMKAIGGSILAVGLLGAFRTLERANQGAGVIGGFLGQSTAAQQVATAKGAGLELNEFAQLSATFKQSGFNEQQDINDVFFDLNERVAQAEVDDGVQTLENFKGQRGFDLFTGVLAGIGTMEGASQSLALADLGFGGETGQNLQAVLQQAQRDVLNTKGLAYTDANFAAITQGELKTQLQETNKTEGEKLAALLTKEAGLALKFRAENLKLQREVKKSLLESLGKDESILQTFFDEQQRVADKDVSSVEAFTKNQQAATKVQSGLDDTLKHLETATTMLITFLQDQFGIQTPEEIKQQKLQEKEDLAQHENTMKHFGGYADRFNSVKKD